MSALNQRLQKEPTLPDGSPSRRAITTACQIAAQSGHFCPEGAQGHSCGRAARALSQYSQRQRVNHLIRRTLRILASVLTYLHQAHGKRRQQTKQTDQALNTLPLPFLDATPAFETLVIVLNGTITNDKFCMSRSARLRLSWWRLPLHARAQVAGEVESPSEGNIR